MASSYLGPESPRPLAVISEGYQKRWNLPDYLPFEKYNFGRKYEEAMVRLIHKYLELGTTDRLCYVGDVTGSLAPLLQERFCLLEPMTAVLPGHVRYLTTDNSVIPVPIAHTGADEYFRLQAAANQSPSVGKPAKGIFDKVILKDAVSYVENSIETYRNILGSCGPDGKLLIIHRAGNLNTLPLFRDAKQRLGETDKPYETILKDLYACNFDVKWNIEYVPVRMAKIKWLTMMKDKFPPEMQVLSNFEIFSGVRDLSEGVLKYEGEEVEFLDRLLFITATPSFTELAYPRVQKYGANRFKPFPTIGNVKMELEVTSDIKGFVSK